jgi:hypothetical protein
VKKLEDDSKYSGFVLTFEPGRSELIDAALRYGRQEATEALSSRDWKLFPRELVFLSFSFGHDVGVRDKTIDGMILMQRLKVPAATGKWKVRLESPVMFENPIELREFSQGLRRALRLSSPISLVRLEQKTWRRLIERAKVLRPDTAQALDRLIALRNEDRRIFPSNTRTTRLMEQRDAVGIAVEMAGLDRPSVLGSLDRKKIASSDSVLDLLDHEPLQEQDALRIDRTAFGALLGSGMKHARFSDSRGAQVRVHIYDKKPLESILGIDLLIYMPLYRAYILLQYKMMQKQGSSATRDWQYSVDRQLRQQLTAMTRAAVVMQQTPPSPLPVGDWRLTEEVFFWKFCEPTRVSDSEGSLVHGITLSRTHMESFLRLKDSLGPGGGRRVGYGSCKRYLTNSQFVELARAGWIGGGQGARTILERILRASQRGGRQAILAVVLQAETLADVRRGWQ